MKYRAGFICLVNVTLFLAYATQGWIGYMVISAIGALCSGIWYADAVRKEDDATRRRERLL